MEKSLINISQISTMNKLSSEEAIKRLFLDTLISEVYKSENLKYLTIDYRFIKDNYFIKNYSFDELKMYYDTDIYQVENILNELNKVIKLINTDYLNISLKTKYKSNALNKSLEVEIVFSEYNTKLTINILPRETIDFFKIIYPYKTTDNKCINVFTEINKNILIETINNYLINFEINNLMEFYFWAIWNKINIDNIFFKKTSVNINKLYKYLNKNKDSLINDIKNFIKNKKSDLNEIQVFDEIHNFFFILTRKNRKNKISKFLYSILFLLSTASIATGATVFTLTLSKSQRQENRLNKFAEYEFIPTEIKKIIDITTDDITLRNINNKYKYIFEINNQLISNKIPRDIINDDSYFDLFTFIINQTNSLDINKLNDLFDKSKHIYATIEQSIKKHLSKDFIKEINLNTNIANVISTTTNKILKDFNDNGNIGSLYYEYIKLRNKIDAINSLISHFKSQLSQLKLFYNPDLTTFYDFIDNNLYINYKSINTFKNEITKQQIQKYIDYFNQVDYFPLVVDRLNYFKNNLDNNSNHRRQWFITKDKRYTLNPGNEENIEWRLPYLLENDLSLNIDYIFNWLKSYDEWLWVINDDPKIESIDLGNVKMFNHHKDFSDSYISETFKDYESFNINVVDWKFWYPKYNIDKDELELEKQFNKLSEIYGMNNFQPNDRDSIIDFIFNPMTPKLDFDLYKKYTLKPNRTFEVSRPTLYYELLTEQPNYFSIFEQNPISSIKIKSDGIVKQNGATFDYPKASKLDKYNDVDSSIEEDEEVVKNQMKQWLQNWITFLPKYISKNWDSKQIIKALSFFITSNVNYMYSNYDRSTFNTDGNGFYNPASLFELDRTLQCYGYSQNLSMSLSLLNIPVRIVSGTYYGDPNSLVASGEHAWNEVFVDNKWVSVDLTFADYSETNPDFIGELDLNEIFLDRDAGSRRKFRLKYSSYITTIIKYLNKDENGNYVHNYVDLPTHYSTDPENELKWENMLPILKAQYK